MTEEPQRHPGRREMLGFVPHPNLRDYWLIDGTDKDGPFCQHCYDKGHELIRLQGNGQGYWQCKACKNDYRDSTHRVPLPQVISRDWP